MENATASGWQNNYNITTTYTCFDGYQLPNISLPNGTQVAQATWTVQTILCNESSPQTSPPSLSWVNASKLVACTPKYCDAPSNFLFASLVGATGASSYVAGSKVSYVCNTGYKVGFLASAASVQVSCGDRSDYYSPKGVWKPSMTACVRAPLLSSPLLFPLPSFLSYHLHWHLDIVLSYCTRMCTLSCIDKLSKAFTLRAAVRCPDTYYIQPNSTSITKVVDMYGADQTNGDQSTWENYQSVVTFACSTGLTFNLTANVQQQSYACQSTAGSASGFWSPVSTSYSSCIRM